MSFFEKLSDKIKDHVPSKHDNFSTDNDLDNMLKSDPTTGTSRSASVLDASRNTDPLSSSNLASSSSTLGSSDPAQPFQQSTSSQSFPPSPPNPTQPSQQTQQSSYAPQQNTQPVNPQQDQSQSQFNPLDNQLPIPPAFDNNTQANQQTDPLANQQMSQTTTPPSGTPEGTTGLEIHNIRAAINNPNDPLNTSAPQQSQQPQINQQNQPDLERPPSRTQPQNTYENPSDPLSLSLPADDLVSLKMDIQQIKEKLNLVIEKLNVVEERTARY
ncbi:MAG: hypothetical protein KAJ47_02650 [Candidatus Aenigmarchaeota archaeon]|nr:hypothetical protein [Candidatus Aenigmarchaeota archaeon]